MNTVYLLTGGNVGNRQQYLHDSARLIEASCGKIIRRSALYETAAWGKTDQVAFLNQALELSTALNPDNLMKEIVADRAGTRKEENRKIWGATIDIDILLFNSDIINTALVTIPHVQMANRRFVLEPLHEIAPGYLHPVLKKNNYSIIKNLP